MNKFSNLSKEQMLNVCKIIYPNVKWKFHQILDNDGNGTDDCYEFFASDESCIQFNVHQSSKDEIVCFLNDSPDEDEIPSDKIASVNKYLNNIKQIDEENNEDYLNYFNLSQDSRISFAINNTDELVKMLHKIIEKSQLFKDIGEGSNYKYFNNNIILRIPFTKKKYPDNYPYYKEISTIEIIILKKEIIESTVKTLFGKKKTTKTIIEKGELSFKPFEYLIGYDEITTKEKSKLNKKSKELSDLCNHEFLSLDEKNIIRDIVNLFNKTYKEFLKIHEIKLKNFKNSRIDILHELDKNGDGKIDILPSNDLNLLLKNNQKKIIEIDKIYIQKFVKLDNFIKSKSKNIEKIFESILDTKNQNELEERVNLLKNQIHAYNSLIFHSINMIGALVSEDLITFYEIYESFDKLGMFNSNWENEVSEKLSNIDNKLDDLMYAIYNMEQNIVSELSYLSYVTQQSFEDLNRSVTDQLKIVESSINTNNLLAGIQSYQLYKINKNIKGIS